MVTLHDIRARARLAAGPLIGIALVSYFAYHAVQGDRGLIRWWQLRHDIQQAEASLAETRATRAALEHRVSLLRPESLDPDMLEERARLMLNMGWESDLVVLDGPRQR